MCLRVDTGFAIGAKREKRLNRGRKRIENKAENHGQKPEIKWWRSMGGPSLENFLQNGLICMFQTVEM